MKPKRIYHTLIKHYIVFTLLLVFIIIATLVVSILFLGSIMNDEYAPSISAESLAQAHYEDIPIDDIAHAGGWIEVLNQEGEVIFVNGEKRTPEWSYSWTELMNLVGLQESLPYVYQSQAFLSSEQEQLVLLVVLPSESVEMTLNITFGIFDVSRPIMITLIITVLIFIILYLINIMIYSHWTASRIKTPLEAITQGLQGVIDGQISQPMTFQADHEFLVIRDSFNHMIEQMKNVDEQKMRLEREKNDMFVHISHDLKTPITTIAGFSKALAEGLIKDPDKVQTYLETIHQKANRLSKLVYDVFELSKMNNDDYNFHFQRKDGIETVRKVVAEYYEQAEQKGINLTFSSSIESLLMDIDEKAIERLISNLIHNAIIYNPINTLIDVKVSHDDHHLTILIGDTGIGIDPDVKHHMFVPFQRGEKRIHTQEGSGLGLAITQRIIHKHHGKIQYIDHEGAYATQFIITLPRYQNQE